MHASDYAPTLTELQDKIDRLAAENKRLKERIQKMYCGDLSPESRLNGYAVVVRNLQERLEMAQQALKEQK